MHAVTADSPALPPAGPLAEVISLERWRRRNAVYEPRMDVIAYALTLVLALVAAVVIS